MLACKVYNLEHAYLYKLLVSLLNLSVTRGVKITLASKLIDCIAFHSIIINLLNTSN